MDVRRKDLLTSIAFAAFMWLFMCGAALLILWPWRPANQWQWTAFILGVPVIWGLGEYLGGLFLSDKLSARISRRRFSLLRIAYALIVGLSWLAVLFGIILLAGRILGR